MVQIGLRLAYQRARRQYPRVTASQALAIARERVYMLDHGVRLGGGMDGMVGSVERDGFTLAVTVVPDPDEDLSFLGTVNQVDAWSAVKIERPYWYSWHGRKPDYVYYQPMEGVRTLARYYREEAKLGRHDAFLAANAQVRAALHDLVEQTMYCMVVRVEASRAGILCGMASLGGVTLRAEAAASSDTHLLATIEELIGEAIADAQGNLARAGLAVTAAS